MKDDPQKNPGTDPQKKKGESKKKRKAVYISIIVILLLLNSYLFFNNLIITEEKKEAQDRAVSAEKLKLYAEKNYKEALTEINQYKTDVLEKDSLLTISESELKELKIEIDRLLNQKNISDQNLQKANKLLLEIEHERDSYYKQVDSLNKINKRLLTENKTLGEQLVKEQEQYRQLKKENQALTKKVAKGSILPATNIIFTGLRNNPNNQAEKTTKKAKKAIKLKIAFDIVKNKLTEPGSKTYFIVIKGPNDILYDEARGSGIFNLAETGKEMKYTTRFTFKYKAEAQTVSTYWTQDKFFSSGAYTIDIYYEGYHAGNKQFVLR